MDYDGDGDSDIITGSYTGQFYLFRRNPDGGFAQRELFMEEGGRVLLMDFDTAYSVTPELVDMDADGDLDLIVGNRSGPVLVVDNVGTRKEPVWSKARRELKTQGAEVIKGSNAHHADWNGDGVRDLIVGSELGEVRWYRNVGKNDAPIYEKGIVLVKRGAYERQEEGSVPKRPGQRVKVHVTDWNGDGRVDLLVGDVTWQQSTPNPLTAAEKVEKSKLDDEFSVLQRKRRRARGEAREKLEAAIKAHREKLRPYRRTKSHTHGWVWLYLRKGESKPHQR